MATTQRWKGGYGKHYPEKGSFVTVYMSRPDLDGGMRSFLVTRAYNGEVDLFYPPMLRRYSLTRQEWKRLVHSSNPLNGKAWTPATCIEFIKRRVQAFEEAHLRFRRSDVNTALSVLAKEIARCSPSSQSSSGTSSTV